MKNILSPISGNPKGYLRVKKTLEDLLNTIQNNVLVAFSKKPDKGTNANVFKSKSSGNSYIALRQKVTTGVIFQEYFNASLQSNFGNLFFDIDDSELRNDEAGVRVISYESFDNYKNAETAKYYTSPNANVKISKFLESGS